MFEISILVMIIIFMFGAFLKGWSGFGTNLVVPPLLLFMSRFTNSKETMVVVVSVNLVLNLAMLIQSKRFNYKFLQNIGLLVIVGVTFNFVGSFFLKGIDDSLFRILLGSMIILVTINRLYKLKFKIEEIKWYHYVVTGVISGILNGMFGLGGIPVLILLSSTVMDKQEFKSTLVSYFFVMNVIYIISTGILGGYYNTFVFTNILYVVVFAVSACMIGVYMSSRVSDKIFQRVMNFVLIFFGINLIYVGFVGEHIFNLLR